jgi:hypothetical protein
MILQFRQDMEEAGTNFRGPTMLHVYLALSLFADCTNYPFRPNPDHSATDSYRFNVNIFNLSALAGEPPKKISPGARTRYQRPCYSVVYML